MKIKRINLVIALLMAISLWVYVLLQVNPFSNELVRNVPITYLNEDTLAKEGLIVLNKEYETVTVSYSGQRSYTDKVKASDFRVLADLEDLKAGENTVRLYVSGPQDVQVDGTNPQKVKIHIDRLVEEDRNISIRIINQHSDDSEPHIVQVSSDTVKVKGAETLVAEVVNVRAAIDASKVGNQMKALNVELVPVDGAGEVVEGVQLEFDNISVTTILHNKKTVTLTVPIIGNDSHYITREVTIPKSITIKGSDAKLEEIVLVECEPVDVSHIYKDTSIPIKPILPEGIEVAMNSEHLQVKVVAVDAATRIFTFTENDIVLEGVTEGMIPDIEDISVDIKVSGNDEAVASIAESDFSISADVRGLEPGEHIVPLKCICKNNLLELEYNPKEIKVIIEGKKAEENNTEKPPKQESQDSSQQGASKEPGGNVADENLSQNQGEGEI